MHYDSKKPSLAIAIIEKKKGDKEESEKPDLDEKMVGLVKELREAKDDKDAAMALKEFIYRCMEQEESDD
jgi:hypothetical protein